MFLLRTPLFAFLSLLSLSMGAGVLLGQEEDIAAKEKATLSEEELAGSISEKAAVSAKKAKDSAEVSSGEMETDAIIWGGLVLAVDGEFVLPKEGEDFAKLAPRLAKVFPEKNFQLLGQHTQELFKQYESWVVPSKEIFLKLDSRGPAKGGGLKVHLQLWQDEAVPVKTDATLRPGSPLFISGPKYGDGTLIFVVLLKAGE